MFHLLAAEKPLERLLTHGPEILSDVELLSLILWVGGGVKGSNILQVCRMVLMRAEGIHGLDDISMIELQSIQGIGPVKAAKIKAVVEIAKRYQVVPLKFQMQLKCSQDVIKCFMPHMRSLKKEVFKVINLDVKNKIINMLTVSEGDLSSTIVNPREVYREAIRSSAAGMIVIHNHPSGDPTPSREDILITSRLLKAGNLINIKLIDHVIIGENSYCSFADEGRLNPEILGVSE
jgi:DNA repair protein RadC